ncbi:MAG: hypothetical protein ACI30R_10250 [Sodaliphilus sp.]
MENNKHPFDQELEEMRVQMAELKQHLDQQIQVNERLLKKNIIDKSDKINRFGLTMLIVGIATAILVPILFYSMYDFSIACCVVTSLMVLCDAVHDYYNAHRVKKIDFSTQNFTEALVTLLSVKKRNRTSFAVGMACVMPLMVWWAFELYSTPFFNNLPADAAQIARIALLVVGAIGVLIGVVVAIALYKKQTRNISTLIQMLQENE